MADRPNYDPKKWVVYYSTCPASDDEPHKGYPSDTQPSINAQRAAIIAAAKEAGATILAAYQDTEARYYETTRAALSQAIADAMTRRAVLVVAKHDRLPTLMGCGYIADLVYQKGVRVKVLDMPDWDGQDPYQLAMTYGVAAGGVEFSRKIAKYLNQL